MSHARMVAPTSWCVMCSNSCSPIVNRFIVKANLNSIFTNVLKNRKKFIIADLVTLRLSLRKQP